MPDDTFGTRLRFWVTAAIVLALDVATKGWAEHTLLPGVPHRVVGDFVRFTLAYNPGAAFGMSVGPLSRVFFGAIAVVALVILWRIQHTALPGEKLKPLAAGLVWGGALGNLIDRVRSPRGVVDFLDIGVGSTRFWTFNVADSGVTIGAILLAWVLWKEDQALMAAARHHGDASDASDASGASAASDALPRRDP
jgi:signal peptidase II